MLHGIINVYKEKGYTSHDVVAILRRITKQKKVGHTGTLDPEAEGVLPVCFGKATKVADYIMADTKEYQAQVKLGVLTDTQDQSGKILETRPVAVSEEEIRQAVESFQGEYVQMPPMYSAIKINGKKLYELARKGQTAERKTRTVFLFECSMISYMPPDVFTIRVVCSKGTYIRTLCADLGEKLTCGAHMANLLRVRSGKFQLGDSVRLSELETAADQGILQRYLIPIEQALQQFGAVVVKEQGTKLMHNGGKIYESLFAEKIDFSEKLVLGYDFTHTLVGIYRQEWEESQGQIRIVPIRLLMEQ